MKKWVMAIAMAAMSCCAFAEGLFTVTQYNMTRRPNSISDAESVINNPSSWDGNPVTKHYDRVSFADNPGVIPPYATVSFPGNGVSKHDCFVIEAIGSIRLSAGHWTFACGGDDGYEVSISGHNFTKTFSSNTPLGYEVLVQFVWMR